MIAHTTLFKIYIHPRTISPLISYGPRTISSYETRTISSWNLEPFPPTQIINWQKSSSIFGYFMTRQNCDFKFQGEMIFALWNGTMIVMILFTLHVLTDCKDCKNTPGIEISGTGSGTAIPDRVGSGNGPYYAVMNMNKCWVPLTGLKLDSFRIWKC